MKTIAHPTVHRRILAVVAVIATVVSMLVLAPPASAAVATAPGAPTAVTAVAFDRSAVVWFTAPASDGGAPVTSYTVTATDTTSAGRGGQTCTTTDSNAGCTVAGLTNADNYTFTVTATNAVGTGVASAASSAVTPAVVTAVEISAGGNSDSFCARLSNGTAVCWGRNLYGALGDGTTVNRSTPVQVKGVGGVGLLTNVTSLGGGQHHRCAVLTSGGLVCWGSNVAGQLGDGTTVNRSTPVRVVNATGGLLGDSPSTKVSSVAGPYNSTCAVLVSGNVLCWGSNTTGVLGDGTTTTRLKPVQVTGVGGTGTLSDISSISGSGLSICALQTSGGVVCWGYNDFGGLGDGTSTMRFSPVQVKGVGGSGTLSGVSAISTTQRAACALVSGAVYCWGGTLDVSVIASGPTPRQVPGVGGSGTLSDVSSISGGSTQTCGVLSSGDVVCWLASVVSMSRSGVVAVAGGGASSFCSLLAVGSVRCWGGANSYGQFGNGTLSVDLVNLATAIAAPPTSPTVVSKASQRATVSWTGATGALRYTVTATDTTSAGRGGQTCTTGSTSCTLTGLTNGDNYKFAVTAYNGFLTSAASAFSSSTAITGTPVAPTGLVATVASETSVSVSFTPGSNGGSAITKYQYSTNAGSSWADVSSGGTSSPVAITGLTAMTKYSITLRAVNATGNGESSAAVSVTPMEQVYGDAYTNVAIPGLRDVFSAGEALVQSVSCASEGNCSAGGYFVEGALGDAGISRAFLASQVSGVWQSASLVQGIPADMSISQVTSVSCTTAGNCSAGGYYESFFDNSVGRFTRHAFVLTQVGGVWGSAVDVPGLADLDVGQYSQVNAVSCASAGNCVAGGNYSNVEAAYASRPFAVSQVDGDWQAAALVSAGPGVVLDYSSFWGESTAVSCPGVGNCVVAGWDQSSGAFVVSLVDGEWQSPQAIPGQSDFPSSGYSRVTSISCSSVGNCAVVGDFPQGEYLSDSLSLDPLMHAFVASEVNGVWQSAIAVTPPVQPDKSSSDLRSVSCPSDGNCSAVGYSNIASGTAEDADGVYDILEWKPMAISLVGGIWQTAIEIPSSGIIGVPRYQLNSSISCWSAGNCAAGGGEFTAMQAAGTWASATSTAAVFLSVSCPTQNCTFGRTGSFGQMQVIRQKNLVNKFASAPVGLVATASNASVSIAFAAGDAGPGGAITNYKYSKDNGATWTTLSPSSTASPMVISGLTNGTPVNIRLRAVDANGDGAPSDALSVTSATTPSAPTSLVATATSGGASITFTAGATGGSAITKYQYTIDDGSTWVDAVSGTASPVAINGLTDGTTYSVKLRAVNAVGDGAAAVTATSVTPRSTAWMPTSLVATPGDGSASIAFTSPGSDGSSTITNYKYELNGSGTYVALSPTDATSPVTIPGLTNGTTYSVKLLAVNAAGDGYGSDAVSVTPVSPATVPAAPTTLAATPGNGSASIAFTPGAAGTYAITKYQYQIGSDSWTDVSSGGTSSPSTITGLVNGTPYSIKLRAYSAAGGGTASEAVSVTPRTAPDAPTSPVATPGNGSVSIAFTPGATGGDAITKYQYSTNDGGAWTDVTSGGTSSPSTITGLVNGTSYSIKLRAYNAAGGGTASEAVSVTPYLAPFAPTGLTATPGNGSVSIAFTPGAAGTYAITKYQYTIDNGVNWTDVTSGGTSSPVVITGLVNYVTNSIKLRAFSAAGGGTSSTAVSVTTKISAPAITTAYSASQSGNSVRGMYVGFTGINPLGANMVSYRINIYAKGTNTLVSTALVRPTDRGYFLGGLTKGVEYDIRVIGYLTLTGSPLLTRGTYESSTTTARV